MLFSRKLTQDADHNEMEFLLSQLIIQWFDRSFNWQNSLVRQLFNVFFKSFVLFSQQRCELMLRGVAKVVYSIVESKYGGGGIAKKKKDSSGKKKPQPKIKQNKKTNVRRGKRRDEDESDEEENESDYNVGEDNSFVSDDSRCA